MPVMFMLIAIFLFSLWTPVINFCIQSINLWEFIFWTELICFTLSFIILKVILSKNAVKHKRLRDLSAREAMIFGTSGFCRVAAMGLLFTSFFYLSVAAAISVYDFWPIIALYLAPALVSKDWSRVTPREVVYSLVAVGGVFLLLMPETRAEFFAAEDDPFKRWGILLLPLISGLLNALSGVINNGLVSKMQIKDHPFLSIFVVDINYGFFCVMFAGLGWLASPHFMADAASTYTPEAVGGMLFFSLVIVVLGRLSFVLARARAKTDLMVLWFILPILTLFWLWLFGMAEITGEIVLGAAMITVANLLISARPDDRISYPATLIALLLISVYCFFTDGLDVEDYYEVVSVPLFFYAIIVAFLMERLIRRDRFEEDIVVEITRHVEQNGPREVKKKVDLIRQVTSIIRTNDLEEVDRHYQKIRNAKHKWMLAITDKLDALVLSRLQGANFGEMLVLLLIGFLSILTLTVYRPPYFVGDAFAIILSAATVFVFFTTVDLIRLRRKFFLDVDAKGHFKMSKEVTRITRLDMIVSIVLVMVVVTAMMGVMWFQYDDIYMSDR